MKIAVLISGRGSNMAAILREAARMEADVRFLVLSNRPKAAGLETAAALGAETAVLSHRPYGRERRADFDRDLAAKLRDWGADWVVLAGFMRILGAEFIRPFAGRILNIHPSLLPKYPGLHTHERALAAGDPEHGCTVHLVDESLDGGPIVAQARVPVLDGDDPDTLAARVLVQEHRLYPAVVLAAARGELAERYPAREQ